MKRLIQGHDLQHYLTLLKGVLTSKGGIHLPPLEIILGSQGGLKGTRYTSICPPPNELELVYANLTMGETTAGDGELTTMNSTPHRAITMEKKGR